MKKLILFASLVLSINAFAQIPTNGLVGYWPFNGNANDESGNNNGHVHGATLTTDQYGNALSAYRFDGIDDYITLLAADNVYNKFSVSGWFLFRNSVNNHAIGSYSITNDGWGWKMLNGSVLFFATNGNYYSSSVSLDTMNWYHVVITYDGSQRNIYINGLACGSSTMGKITQGDSILIGAIPKYMTGFSWKGNIDDIRIYNRALNQAEISRLNHEHICYQTLTVTDTLLINVNLKKIDPVTYENVIKIYPNPTNDKITIDCGKKFGIMIGYRIKIMNYLSQPVYTSLINQQFTTIDLNDWAVKGIYIVHLIDPGSNIVANKKIVLQ